MLCVILDVFRPSSSGTDEECDADPPVVNDTADITGEADEHPNQSNAVLSPVTKEKHSQTERFSLLPWTRLLSVYPLL